VATLGNRRQLQRLPIFPPCCNALFPLAQPKSRKDNSGLDAFGPPQKSNLFWPPKAQSELPPMTHYESTHGPPTSSEPPKAASRSAENAEIIAWNQRLRWELQCSRHMFFLEEPVASHADLAVVSEKGPLLASALIDVRRCFSAPRPYCITPLVRLFLFLWSVQVLAYDLWHYSRTICGSTWDTSPTGVTPFRLCILGAA